jgi:hypothetical protein
MSYQSPPLEYRVAGARNVWGGSPVIYSPNAQGSVRNMYGRQVSRGMELYREITAQELYRLG